MDTLNFRQYLTRCSPRLTPEVFATSIALLAVAVSRPAPQFWQGPQGLPSLLGILVMVTVLFFRVLTDCTEMESVADKAMGCQQPHAAIAFTFATGSLIACQRPEFATFAFVIMIFYFQIWRLNQATSARDLHQNITYLPDPKSLASFMREQVPAVMRRKKKLHMPSSVHQFLRWFIPIALIVFLMLKMGY